MIQTLLDSTTIPLLEQVARFSELRQQFLAGNITNLDTPNCKSRDLPVEAFRKALKEAVIARRRHPNAGTLASVTQQPKSLNEIFSEQLFQPVLAPAQNLTSLDGNNRNVETAVMEMKKNTGMQRFAIEVMAAQLNLLQAVISERA